ncbi:MAG TPA: hypothetical protein VMU19_00535, partial [Bryobacteraceae bacterium]|nr:hypothetical protein [Bryobacteraceae bacterium]
CALRGERDRAAACRAAAERAIGSKAAAALLIFGVAHDSKHDALGELPAVESLSKSERALLPEAVVRVVELAKDMQVDQEIPGGWLVEAARQFQRAGKSLDVGQLQTLAEAALTAGNHELAYAVSAAGLDRGGAGEANFLLLRALALPDYYEERKAICAAAAAQLARQRRHMEVVDKAVDLLSESGFDSLSLSPEQASQVLRQEQSESAFPTPNRPGPQYREFFEEPLCDCPECRRQRKEGGNPFEDFEEDAGDLDLDGILGGLEIPPDLPPQIAKMIFEETRKAVDRGESVDSLINRIFGGAGFGGRRRKGRRR